MKKSIRSYNELCQLPTFEERYEYLKLNGRIGEETFGSDRYLNQVFYTSDEWKEARRIVILRDNGCDLGIPGREIKGPIYVHHMNPIRVEDILRHSSILVRPEFLICTSKLTHDAIHYGDEGLLQTDYKERKPFDTCPWRL